MSTHEILIPLAAVLVTVTLSAIINTKIKFAQTAPQAMADIRNILLLVVFWISQAYLVWALIFILSSDEPLTRRSLIFILIVSFGLFHTYLMYWLSRVLTLLEKMTVVTGALAAVTFGDADPKTQPNKTLEPTAAVPPVSKHG
jgi:hypothetical protein